MNKLHSSFLAVACSLSIFADPAHAGAPTQAELATCLSGDAPLPAVFAKLQKGMTAANVDALFPGAKKVSKYGFSRVKASRYCRGAKEFTFFFKKETGELQSATIKFEPRWSKDDAFYADLVAVLAARYGEPKPEAVEKRLITWVEPKTYRTTQLHMMPERGGYSLQLRVSLPE